MNIKFLSLLIASGLFLSACSGAANVVEPGSEHTSSVSLASIEKFDQAAYEKALGEGKDVFLDFKAEWCTVCAANGPKIEAAFEELASDDLVGFEVNYDFSDDLQKEFDIVSQSTLVLIPGGKTDAFKTLGPGLLTKDKVLDFLKS